jgi:dienelactone hydrolase
MTKPGPAALPRRRYICYRWRGDAVSAFGGGVNGRGTLGWVSALWRFACRCLAVAALAGLALAAASPASAEQKVRFDSAAMQGSERGTPIQGYLTRPKGEGRFPAVVLLHSCLGLPANRRSIGQMFADWGYVALFVDDFATRGVRETCARDFPEGLSDAYGALAYLSGLPSVDRRRIAAVGYSQGADTALRIASAGAAGRGDPQGGLNFKAAVAFYPPCGNQPDARLELPTLILIGKEDDVTPAADCERLAGNQAAGGSGLKLVVYPGAYHLFDDPGLAEGKRLFGMRLQYDAPAAARSRSETRDFLAAKLAR